MLRVARVLLLPGLCLLLAAACSSPRAVREESPARTGGGLRLIFTERAGGVTTVWAALPHEPAERQVLARLSHDPEWGVRASLSPDGRYLAATLVAPPVPGVPDAARGPDREAVLTLLDLTARTSRRLASGLDLRTTPVWAADSAAVLVQRVRPSGVGSLVRVDLAGAERIVEIAAPGHRLVPVSVAAGGGPVMLVDWEDSAAWLRRIEPDGTTRTVGRLGDGPVRALAPAPDGSALAYLRLEPAPDGPRYRTAMVQTRTGDVTPLYPERERQEDTGVAWGMDGPWVSAVARADGGGVLLGGDSLARVLPGGSDARAGVFGRRAEEGTGVAQERVTGFDALVGASPDGRWLVVREFAEGTSREPGTETLTLIGADGARVPVRTAGGAVLAGWRWP